MTPGTCAGCGRAVVQVRSDSGQLFIVERTPRVFVMGSDGKPHLLGAAFTDGLWIDHQCLEKVETQRHE